MNYRHAFHAGNFADVLKHVVLALCLDRLNQKETAYRYIDTHAGAATYDMTSEEALRSPEWRDGVARVWSAVDRAKPEVREALKPYVDLLLTLNGARATGGKFGAYPGSPKIAAMMMRAGDAIRLCELHPESAERLRAAVGGDARVKIEERDGFEALPAYLPPPERRGAVLIDPPFEEGTAERRLDFERMLKAARKAIKRWPQGTYILWRPIKDLDQVDAFDGELASWLIEEAGLAPEKLLVADLWVRPLPAEKGLAGAGVVIVNPPFGLEERLRVAMPWLANLMDQTDDESDESGGWRLVSATEQES